MGLGRLLTRNAALRPLVASFMVAAVSAIFPSGAGASSTSYPPFTKTGPAEPAACREPAQSPAPRPARVAAIEKEVMALVGKSFEGIGQCGPGLLFLKLMPGSERVAHTVRATFGSSVQIMVGLTVWNGRPGRSPVCGDFPRGAPSIPGYATTLDLRSSRVRSGDNLQGVVVFRNTGKVAVRVDSVIPVEVVITLRGTRRIVGMR